MKLTTTRILRRSLMLGFLLSISLNDSLVLGATGGSLPRGEARNRGQSVSADAPSQSVSECGQYVATTVHGDLLETMHGDVLMLARHGKGSKSRLSGMRLDQEKKTSRTLFSAQDALQGWILPHGVDLHRYTMVFSQSPDGGCVIPNAKVTSISLAKKPQRVSFESKAVRVARNSQMVVIESGEERMLADMDTGHLFAIDPVSFQQKKIFEFGKRRLPLYFNELRRQLFVVDVSGASAELQQLSFGRFRPVRKLSLQAGQKLVRDQDKFAVITLNSVTNSIKIRELEDWTQLSKPKSYELNIPKDIPVDEMAIDINFKKKTTLIYSMNQTKRRSGQAAYVMNYAKQATVQRIAPAAKRYLQSLSLAKSGTAVLTLEASVDSQETLAFKRVDINSKKTYQWPVKL